MAEPDPQPSPRLPARLSAALRGRRKRVSIASVTTALALVGVFGTVRVASADEVSVTRDGMTTTVRTTSDDAGELLASMGVEVGPHDEVRAPESLGEGSAVEVVRAQQYTLILDGNVSMPWSTGGTVGAALEEMLNPEQLDGAAISQPSDMPLGPDAVSVNVVTRKNVDLVMDGRTIPVVTNAKDVAGLLEAERVPLGTRDLVIPGPQAVIEKGATVRIVRLTPTQSVENVPIAHGSREQSSADLYVGQRKVATQGRDGVLTRIYEVVTENGVITQRRLMREQVSVPAVDTVILVGTRERSTGASRSSSGGSGTGSGGSGSGGGPYVKLGNTVWDDLATCESGNNWQINTGNGYYGGLQFDLPTWKDYGGTGYPHEHSREEQIAVAERLHAKRGFAPWPACSRKLGLL